MRRASITLALLTARILSNVMKHNFKDLLVLPGLNFQINLSKAQSFEEKKSSRVPHLFVNFVITETGRSVDMTYLRFKWAEMFNLLDVNHDEILDKTDSELSTELLHPS